MPDELSLQDLGICPGADCFCPSVLLSLSALAWLSPQDSRYITQRLSDGRFFLSCQKTIAKESSHLAILICSHPVFLSLYVVPILTAK